MKKYIAIVFASAALLLSPGHSTPGKHASVVTVASAQAAPVIFNGARVLAIGDSITDDTPFTGDSPAGTGNAWWMPLIKTLLPATVAPGSSTFRGGALLSGRGAKLLSGARMAARKPGINVEFYRMAYPNMTTQTVAGHVTDGELAGYRPDIVFWLCGINDAQQGVSTATTQTYFDLAMASIQASLPNTQIVVLSLLYPQTEQTTGSTWIDLGALTRYNGANAVFASDVGIYGATVVDTAGANLAWELANNIPQPGVANGLLTRDGVHPIAAGKNFASQTVLNALTIR